MSGLRLHPGDQAFETWETRARRDQEEATAWGEAKRAILRDDVVVYDACANVGQIKSNLPALALRRIVANFLLKDCG